MYLLRSFIFYLLYSSSLIFIAIIGIFTIPLPYKYRYAWLSLWAKFNIISLKFIVGISCDVKGIENIPNSEKKVIVLSNHQSTWETLFFQTLFKEQTWLLKRELLWIPIFGWSLACLKPIAINRTKGTESILKLFKIGKQRLDENIWLIIFPEGTRKPYEENQNSSLPKLKMGGMKLAAENDCLILMIKHNSGKYWPKKGRFQKGKIYLEIAPAFKSNNANEIREKCSDFFYGK